MLSCFVHRYLLNDYTNEQSTGKNLIPFERYENLAKDVRIGIQLLKFANTLLGWQVERKQLSGMPTKCFFLQICTKYCG